MSYMSPGTRGSVNKVWNPPAAPEKKKKMRGLGDLVQWGLAKIGVELVVKRIEKATGKPCGCSKRQDKLNEMVPFSSRSEDESGNIAN